jgi:hypothetical protein
MCGDSTRGSLVDSVVVEQSGNRAFVPHASHGIAFRETVAYNVWDDAYWWDPGANNATNDILYENAAAFYVKTDPSFRGYRLAGFELGRGENNACVGCVAAGVQGNVNAAGFVWPEHSGSVWEFRDAVSHNNRTNGLFVWQNTSGNHDIDFFTAYGNGKAGVDHGAYLNGYRYTGGRLWGNRTDVILHALSGNSRPLRFDGMLMGSDTSVTVEWHGLVSNTPTVFANNDLRGSIMINESRLNGGIIRFESSESKFDLKPDRFQVKSIKSKIQVSNSDGSIFDVGT